MKIAHPKLAECDSLSPDALEFCQRYAIGTLAKAAASLASECFNSNDVNLRMESDPESEEQWLIVHVAVRGEVEDIVNRYENYQERWNKMASWQERYHIRLVYDFS